MTVYSCDCNRFEKGDPYNCKNGVPHYLHNLNIENEDSDKMTRKCSTCDGTRLADISAKCSDMFSMTCDEEEIDDYNGYALCEMNIGGDDYVEFEYCLDCGQMVGNWPVIIPDEAWNRN